MATLGSPGVQVTVVDESFYTPAAPGTVPMVFIATAQDKSNASKTGTAQGTMAENAGKVYIITSQRDLTDTFGTPLFYTDTNGSPIHGNELNEYGLQAAYSVLGVSSRAYVVRADVDLAQLVPSTSEPSGDAVAGTYWLDTNNTLYGINEWDATGGANRKGQFVVKTPLIIDADNVSTAATLSGDIYIPNDSFGKSGDYAIVATSNNTNAIWYKTTAGTGSWTLVQGGFNGGKKVTIAPHTAYPDYTTSTGNSAATGSVWIKTTAPGFGANWIVKYYNGSTESWTNTTAPVYESTRRALQSLDYAGGGRNIPVGTLFVESDYEHNVLANAANAAATFKLWRRNSTGETKIVSPASTATSVGLATFSIRETRSSTSTWSAAQTVTISSNASSVASQIPTAMNTLTGLLYVSASYDSVTRKVTFTHSLGGDFELLDGTGSPLTSTAHGLGMTAYDMTARSGVANLYEAPALDGYDFLATNWKPLVYEAKGSTPSTDPANGTLWYNSSVVDVDIMYHDGTKWVGYRNAFPNTDPAGPIVSALEPMDGDRSDSGNLVNGDIWISTANLDRYGKDIYVYDGDLLKWILQNTADQTSPSGWLFADARWSGSGSDTAPDSIQTLLTLDYVDPDAPDPALYPRGMRLWNLRRSGYNIKKYIAGHIDITANDGLNVRYQNDDMSGYNTNRWVTVSPNNEDGSGKFGRHAQRGYVVSQLKALIDTNIAARDTDTLTFNLLACPGYTEAIANLVALNTDRGQTAFVVGDTPFRLQPNGTALAAWGNNTALAFDNSDAGAVTYDEYLGMFYPSGYTTDNVGNNIVVPPSHMMLRTIINSDAKSYQWFAPAGTRRGGVDNATSVGYIDEVGEFKTASLYEGLRNVLHDVKINPIATLPGVGIVNFGQYTRARNASALDRINVTRLIAYLRRQLIILAKPFLFEPNDEQTRREIKAAAESLLLELVGQRALYDFIVVCDKTNNTPARIDRSELYMDIAIEPVKAVEFIYIPLRIKNTGEIASGQ